ncbi:unnamed protein product [Tilletia controversa]|uniref:Uncharacterized protein n=3 Tax=Tilletia TaxID=13289 RepID=A0A8X7MNP6_9BASI|nr:hypothetical protein CF336_g7604 [Tilletia laevis]KAE8191194.1 hypothetical protein CF328_g5756 [Tilletia controversa]KAE8251597.1 hypothetical protein A4X03_0g6346 [Tilletia caries]KAE8188266.1 hypothetical protein CF335_g6942 [Tilletia laevis]KAE8243289.1 hypothetical protein A4X06_0g6422 [Tilletia controversa]
MPAVDNFNAFDDNDDFEEPEDFGLGLAGSDIDDILNAEVNRPAGDAVSDDDMDDEGDKEAVGPPSRKRRRDIFADIDDDNADDGRQEPAVNKRERVQGIRKPTGTALDLHLEEYWDDSRPIPDELIPVPAIIECRRVYNLDNEGVRDLLLTCEIKDGKLIMPPRWAIFSIGVGQKLYDVNLTLSQEVFKVANREAQVEEKLDAALAQINELKELIREMRGARLGPGETKNLTNLTAQVFYSNNVDSYGIHGCLFPALQRLITQNPLLIGKNCKEIIEGDDIVVKREQIWSKIKEKLSNFRCHARDYIWKSLGENGGAKQTLLKLFRTCTKSYGVRITKERIVRLALLRYLVNKIKGRLTNGKTNEALWNDVDDSLKLLWTQQRNEPNAVKTTIHKIFESDKKRFGTFRDSDLQEVNAHEKAIKNALRDEQN